MSINRRFAMLKPLFIILTLCLGVPATAQAQMDSFIKCMTDSTSGRDRKDLARWIFAAISIHPEIRELATTSEGVSDKTSETMGRLVTRLITENCPKEVQAMGEDERGQAINRAFEMLGQLAIMELTADKSVAESIGRFDRYLDRSKINAVLGTK